jgi:AcrR family transcriptional regulator
MTDADDELRERSALLDRLSLYAADVGIAALTIEGAAAASGVSPERLQSYFDSREELLVAIIARNRIRLRERVGEIDLSTRDVRRLGRTMWEFYLANSDESKIFFETYGLALHDPHYGVYLDGVKDWIALLRDRFTALGMPDDKAEALATLALAVYRGAMMDFFATGERARINAAMELFYEAGAALFER